jgi:hypothetical protein
VAAWAEEIRASEAIRTRLITSHTAIPWRGIPAVCRNWKPLIGLIVQIYGGKSSFFFIYIKIEGKASVVLRYNLQAYYYQQHG